MSHYGYEYDGEDSYAGQGSSSTWRTALGEALFQLTGEDEHQLGLDESTFRHTSQKLRNALDGSHWKLVTSTQLGLVHDYLAQTGEGLNPGRFQPLFALCRGRQHEKYEQELAVYNEAQRSAQAQPFIDHIARFEPALAHARKPVETLNSKQIQSTLAKHLVDYDFAAHHHQAVSTQEWNAMHRAAHKELKPHIRALQANWASYVAAYTGS